MSFFFFPTKSLPAWVTDVTVEIPLSILEATKFLIPGPLEGTGVTGGLKALSISAWVRLFTCKPFCGPAVGVLLTGRGYNPNRSRNLAFWSKVIWPNENIEVTQKDSCTAAGSQKVNANDRTGIRIAIVLVACALKVDAPVSPPFCSVVSFSHVKLNIEVTHSQSPVQ